MGKKLIKQQQKKSFPWPLVALGGVLLIAVIVFWAANNQNNNHGGTPKLTVDRQVIDFGNLKDFTDKTFSITVTNTGTGILSFKEKPYVQVVEGCCPPDLTIGSMTLKPGDSTTVTSATFMMHPGMDGKHDYAVQLITNDPAQPDMVVNVLSNWRQ
jgi:hypothetical protein